MAKKIDLSVIIVSYNTAELTKACIESLYKFNKAINFEVIVVDNASKDESIKMLSKLKKAHKDLKIIKNDQNLGFSKANNQGIELAKGRNILLLNSDTEFRDGFFKPLLEEFDKKKDVGIATCALKNPDGSLQITGGYFPNLLNVFAWMTFQDLPFVDLFIKPFHPKRPFKRKRYLDWVTGAFFLVKKSVIDQIGYLDEDYFMYTEEVDFCFRAKEAGWKVLYLPKWSIIHYGGQSSVPEFAILSEFKGVKTFFKKHYANWKILPLRIFLKIGAFWRIFLVSPKIYLKAFKQA